MALGVVWHVKRERPKEWERRKKSEECFGGTLSWLHATFPTRFQVSLSRSLALPFSLLFTPVVFIFSPCFLTLPVVSLSP